MVYTMKVTDPNILQILNEPEIPNSNSMKKVTDPLLLNKLNGVEDKDGNFIDTAIGIGKKIRDDYRGNAQFDFPEASTEIVRREGALSTGTIPYSMAATDQGKADIFKEKYPQSTIEKDKNGNLYAVLDGKGYYLNKPGLSQQDFIDVVSQGSLGLLAASPLGRVGSAAAGIVGSVLGVGAGFGAGSIGQDLIAKLGGSKQNVDLPRAAETAALTAAGEGIFRAASPIFRKIFTDKSLGNPATGEITKKGADVLRDSGINAQDVSSEYIKKFLQNSDVTSPSERIAITDAASLPHPVQLTKGDITRNPTHQLTESEAAKGVYGEQAQSIIRLANDEKNIALKNNAENIQNSLSSQKNARFSSVNQIGSDTQQKLVSDAQSLKTEVKEAYNAAKATKTYLPGDAVKDFATTARKNMINDGYDINNLPRIKSLFDSVENSLPEANNVYAKLNQLEILRKRATNLRRSSDAPERSAATSFVNEYDAMLNNAIDNALIKGDDGAINAWKNARGLRSRYGKIFEQDDIVKKLTERLDDGSYRLAVSPDDAGKLIYGRSSIGAKIGLSKDIDKLKKILPEEDFSAIKEGFFMRLLRGQPTDGNFSGIKFAKEVDRAAEDVPDAIKLVFTPEQWRLIQQFKKVAVNATSKVPGGVNFSNTNAAARLSDRLINSFGSAGSVIRGAISPVTKGVREQLDISKIKAASQGVVDRKSAVRQGAGAELGRELYNNNSNR